jgi:NTE family protein
MTRALVLGGGGLTGIAWEVGLMLGLREAGVDLTDADTIVGTSAGSVVGAQLRCGTSLTDLYDAQLAEAPENVGGTFGTRATLTWVASMLSPGTGRTRRRRLGRAAVRASTRGNAVPAEERVSVIREVVPGPAWPQGDLRITAVDADSGSFVVFDRHGQVDLVHAVASSCAVPVVWPPVAVDGHRYVDGGVRSAANADVARGAERVVVLAPLARSFSRYHSRAAQLARTGARASAAVSPDAAALAAIGRDVLDPAQRAAAAQAGFRQAAEVHDRVRAAWL